MGTKLDEKFIPCNDQLLVSNNRFGWSKRYLLKWAYQTISGNTEDIAVFVTFFNPDPPLLRLFIVVKEYPPPTATKPLFTSPKQPWTSPPAPWQPWRSPLGAPGATCISFWSGSNVELDWTLTVVLSPSLLGRDLKLRWRLWKLFETLW